MSTASQTQSYGRAVLTTGVLPYTFTCVSETAYF